MKIVIKLIFYNQFSYFIFLKSDLDQQKTNKTNENGNFKKTKIINNYF